MQRTGKAVKVINQTTYKSTLIARMTKLDNPDEQLPKNAIKTLKMIKRGFITQN